LARNQFTTAVKLIRGRLKLSQVEFSRLFSVTPTTVSRWERGAILPGPGNLIAFLRCAQSERETAPLLRALAVKHIAISDFNNDTGVGFQTTSSIAEAAAVGQFLSTDSMGRA
jgi:transcriptional regulator with XRE-family HTH domain